MSYRDNIPLQYPELKLPYNKDQFPVFTAGTQTSNVDLEAKLNNLYTELEVFLGVVTRRLRLVEGELKVLMEWGDRRSIDGSEPVSKGDESDCGGLKGDASDDSSPYVKVKVKTSSVGAESSLSDAEPSLVASARSKSGSELSNKFWATVGLYCADITQEHLNILERFINFDADDPELFSIPPLGRHYTEQWAEEDRMEEEREESSCDRRMIPLNAQHPANTTVDDLSCERDRCTYQPLTQRLLASLVQHRIATQAPFEGFPAPTPSPPQTPSECRPAGVCYVKSLDHQIRKRLRLLNVVDSSSSDEDDADTDVNDEVVSEIHRLQAELRSVAAHNRLVAMDILEKARQEMQRQEIWKKAKVLDSEAMEMFRKVTAARQAKRALTKKERDAVWKVIHDRDEMWKRYDSFGPDLI